MSKTSRRCAQPGCRAWARRGELLCQPHRKAQREQLAAEEGESTPPSFYEGVFSKKELADLKRQLESPQRSLKMEVELMRVMIRRVLEHIGEDNPLKALPLVRQGVDAICRAMRTERVLTGEASDSLAEAFATALREIGEELGIGES